MKSPKYNPKLNEYAGPVGSQILGSRFVRDYCYSCGTAMRVVDTVKPCFCEDCHPHKPPPGVPDPTWKDDEDFGGYQANARRILEGD